MKVTFVNLWEDWQGLYIDGKLSCENHILNTREVLKALGVEYNTINIDGEIKGNHLPGNLEDLPKEG